MPITEPDFIQVAVGITVDTEQRVLVAQRPSGKDFAGQWEFPGGKIEADEGVYDALVREFKEELNLEIRAATPLFSCRHEYADRRVELHFWQITSYSGDVRGLEGQQFAWAKADDLKTIDFLEGNRALLERVCNLVL